VPGYRVEAPAPTADGTAGAAAVLPGRGAAQVRMVLQQVDGGWRIADAALVG